MKLPLVLLLSRRLCRQFVGRHPVSAGGRLRADAQAGARAVEHAFGWAEIPVTIATVNTQEGNSAAAGYGVVRGTGRAFARFGVGVYEALLWPFPVYKGTYYPVLRSDIPWIHRGYSEFPPELGNESKYPYVRDY